MEAGQVRKPRKCPSCGHKPFASVIYGLPSFELEERRKAEAGQWILAGCIVTPDDPAWGCTVCGIWMWQDGRIATARDYS
jgi:hypothetical protein